MHRITLVLCMCLVPLGAQSEENLLSCSDLEVQYSAPTVVPLKNRVVVHRLPLRPPRVQEENDPEFKPYSPQRTAAFNRIHIADTTQNGPYTNSIEIFKLFGKSRVWRIDVIEPKDNVNLQWLNEDLLFVRVWWGRIVATDLIFQISSGTFIYAKEANYGLLVQPCNEPNPSIEATSSSGLRPLPAAPHVKRWASKPTP